MKEISVKHNSKLAEAESVSGKVVAIISGSACPRHSKAAINYAKESENQKI